MVGIIFEAPSWCMGYVFLAKGDNKEFLIYETITKVQKILTDIVSYLLWGLTGLGISFIISYVYYTLQCLYLCKKRYNLVLDRRIIIMLAVYSIVSFILIGVYVYTSMWMRFAIGVIFILGVCAYSYYHLNSIVNITDFIRNRVLKKKDRTDVRRC